MDQPYENQKPALEQWHGGQVAALGAALRALAAEIGDPARVSIVLRARLDEDLATGLHSMHWTAVEHAAIRGVVDAVLKPIDGLWPQIPEATGS